MYTNQGNKMKINFGKELPPLQGDGKYLVTSDLHFFHKNILTFCPKTRPWEDKDAMTEGLIDEWNKSVNPDDVVFHLGDFSFAGAQRTKSVISRLNGEIIWLLGNHDKTIRNQIKSDNKFEYLEVKYKNKKICMMHYPILCWNQMSRGVYHLHGHMHGADTCRPIGGYPVLDVGWDAQGHILTLHEAITICDDNVEWESLYL